jgi:hypothetical protein
MIFSKTYRDHAAAAMTFSKTCHNRAATATVVAAVVVEAAASPWTSLPSTHSKSKRELLYK